MATTPLVGSIAAASQWSDAFPTDIDDWNPWTPTFTQGAAVAHVADCSYFKVGRLVIAEYSIAVTGAGTANQPIQMSVPVAAAASAVGKACGALFMNDAGTAFWAGVPRLVSTTLVQFAPGGSSVASMGQTGGGFVAALANTDSLQGYLFYRSAS